MKKPQASPGRKKVMVTSTLRPQVVEMLTEVSSDTGVPKNELIEQGLLMLFAARKKGQKNNATRKEVALG